MITKIAIEGIDGAGKTSVTRELAALFEADGLRANVYAPYHLANAKLGTDIYELWQSPTTAKAAIGVLQAVFDDCETRSRDESADVTIYDRHWMTAFTEIGDDPELVEAWGDHFVPTAMLRVSPQTATDRQANDLDADWSSLAEQERYADVRNTLARKYFPHMLGIYRNDNDVSVEAIARSIQSDMRFCR